MSNLLFIEAQKAFGTSQLYLYFVILNYQKENINVNFVMGDPWFNGHGGGCSLYIFFDAQFVLFSLEVYAFISGQSNAAVVIPL